MSAAVKDEITPLLRSIGEQLGGTWTVTAHVSEPDTADKIEWLRKAPSPGRDFLAVTPQLETAAALAAGEALRRQIASANRGVAFDIHPVIQALGAGAWSHILLRFKGGKRDVPMRALTRRWLATKAAAGRPALIGHGLTGDLVTDLGNATISVRRTGR
jgi:hypothetical protein